MKADRGSSSVHPEQDWRAAGAYLDRIRILENRLTLLYARMDDLREKMAPKLGAQQIYVRTSPGDKTGSLAVAMADLQKRIETTLRQLTQIRAQCARVVEELPPGVLRETVKLIYLESMDDAAAAARMDMLPRNFQRWLKKGLALAARYLPDAETCTDGEKML